MGTERPVDSGPLGSARSGKGMPCLNGRQLIMVNNRVGGINSLRRDPCRTRMRRQLMPIHRRFVPTTASVRNMSKSGRTFSQHGRPNGGGSGGRDSIHGHSAIYNHVVTNKGCVVHDCRVAIDVPHVINRQRPMSEIVPNKIVNTDKCEVVGSQAEIKIDPDMDAVETPAAAGKNGMRGQGSPPAIVAGDSPGDPGRAPNTVGRPNPSTA